MNTVATKRRTHQSRERVVTLPYWFWTGIVLIACWWTIAWMQLRPLSDNYFFPLWVGYFLTVDGLVFRRKGTSLLDRARWRMLYLFLLSIPVWWLFEGFNQVLNNWEYHVPYRRGDLVYALRSSLAFSTVIPAVLVTSELVQSLRLNPLRKLPVLALENKALILLHLGGWVMVGAVLAFPKFAFPLVWISLFLVIDPLATWLNGRSIGSYIRSGDWSPLFNVAIGTLICGFFWEMWNLYALPKWTYSIPYADWLHIFEMPLLGYGGYIPFGFEIFAVYALAGSRISGRMLPEARISSSGHN